MDKLKRKTIGVLRERDGVENTNGKNKTTQGRCNIKGKGTLVNSAGGSKAKKAVETIVKLNSAALHHRSLTQMDFANMANCNRRREWTKEWLKKNQKEFYNEETLRIDIQLRSNEIYHFSYFFELTERQFRHLVDKLSPLISSYQPHRKKKTFSPEERIAITLKYLATGEVHLCRNYCFRATKPVILQMIANICLNMYESLKPFITTPETDEQWQNIANELQRKHSLPNCAGHLNMQEIMFHTKRRSKNNTDFLNTRPLIFTSIVDSLNNFLYIDLERTKARAEDEIYEESNVKNLIEAGKFLLPACFDTEEGISHSYYFACGETLPLKPYLLGSSNLPNDEKKKNDFKHAIDMASTHTKKALCLLANIFPILSQPLRIDIDNARKIILGCVALYNFLRKSDHTFFQQTQKIAYNSVVPDDDCILKSSDDEHDESKPKIVLTSCFHNLKAQKGSTPEGVATRDYIIKRLDEISDTNDIVTITLD